MTDRTEPAAGRYRVIMVDADASAGGKQRMRFAAELASRLGATLCGMRAADLHIVYPIEDVGFPLEQLIAAERAEIERDNAAAREALQRIAGEEKVEHRWKETMEAPTEAFLRQASTADLIVVPSLAKEARDLRRRPNIGVLALGAGRPVMVVPPGPVTARLSKVAVAWKDTREARRALLDALAFLEMAENVSLVAVCEEHEKAAARASLAEVQAYLRHHGIKAHVSIRTGDAEDEILDLCRSNDLVVAGAYGHNRLREWVFGGVTDNLLSEAECCVLLSH